MGQERPQAATGRSDPRERQGRRSWLTSASRPRGAREWQRHQELGRQLCAVALGEQGEAICLKGGRGVRISNAAICGSRACPFGRADVLWFSRRGVQEYFKRRRAARRLRREGSGCLPAGNDLAAEIARSGAARDRFNSIEGIEEMRS